MPTDLKAPSGNGLELWNSINDYRLELTSKIASSHVMYNDNKKAVYDQRFSFKRNILILSRLKACSKNY